MQKIIDIASKTWFNWFYRALPKGFQTYLGENGTLYQGKTGMP